MGEIRTFPDRKNLSRSRRIQHLVNTDEVFVKAQRALSIYPQCLYLQVKAAGVTRARRNTAYIVSLFEDGYFECNRKGEYEPTWKEQQKRARNCLIHLCNSDSPIYLGEAREYFFKIYPEFASQLAAEGGEAVLYG